MIDLFLKAKIRRLMKRNRSKTLLPYDSIHQIVMLYDYDQHEIAMQLMAQLQADGKQVCAWTYSEIASVAEDETDASYHLLNSNDLTFFYFPKQQPMTDYLNCPVDMLLNLSQLENSVLDYLAVMSEARFKVGFKTNYTTHYDFILDVSQTDGHLLTNANCVIDYLKNFRLP